MPAQVEIDESNGPLETITHNIGNANMGDLDLHDMDPTSHPIVPGNYSMAKYHRIHVVNMNTSTKVDDIRIWQTGSMSGSTQHFTNLKTSAYGGAMAYAQPVAVAITGVNQIIPSALPPSANLGIGGSLSGSFSAPGFSDYFVHQLLTDINDTQGANVSMNIQYAEVL